MNLTKSKYLTIGLLLLLLCMTGSATYGQQRQDPFHRYLYSPDRVLQHRRVIGLTDAQWTRIRELIEAAQARMSESQQAIQTASREMERVFQAKEIDEALALKQLERFLDAERELKKRHLKLMVQIRNELKPDQRKILDKIKATESSAANPRNPDDIHQRLRRKVRRIQGEIEKRVRAENPPMDAAKEMEKFGNLMNTGRVDEAEKVLDRVLKMLDLPPSSGRQKGKASNSDADRQEPTELKQLPTMKTRSMKQIRNSVAALYEQDVAWRKIDWETCLLSGIQKSRDQKKPILLWVFIDRPIDDERC